MIDVIGMPERWYRWLAKRRQARIIARRYCEILNLSAAETGRVVGLAARTCSWRHAPHAAAQAAVIQVTSR